MKLEARNVRLARNMRLARLEVGNVRLKDGNRGLKRKAGKVHFWTTVICVSLSHTEWCFVSECESHVPLMPLLLSHGYNT